MPHIGDEPNKTIDNVGAPLDFVQIKLIDPKTRNVVKIGEQGIAIRELKLSLQFDFLLLI